MLSGFHARGRKQTLEAWSRAWVSALICTAMSFQDRLKRAREAQERAAQAQSEAIKGAEEEDARRRSAAGKAATKMLPQVLEAVQALRDDEPRSRATLMARPNPADRWYPGLGPMLGTVQTRAKRRYLPGFAVYQGWGFIGWWVRSEPFEFEVPLDGAPVAGMMSSVTSSPKRSLESFAQKGIYVYHVGEDGPLRPREGTAAQGFSDFLTQVMGHLLTLR
jgi:hypothetical protein